jgi:signal transduction histidine kinase
MIDAGLRVTSAATRGPGTAVPPPESKPASANAPRDPATGACFRLDPPGRVGRILDWSRTDSAAGPAECRREFAALKSKFIREISHRFRNPLGVLSASAELLGSYGDQLGEDQKGELLAQARNAVEDLTRMLDELLELDRNLPARQDSGGPWG